MKKKTFLQELRRQIDERLKIATRALLTNERTVAKEQLEWVKLANKIIANTKLNSNKIRASLLIGSITILLIGLGLTLRIPKANVSADIIAKSVSVKLKDEWVMNNRFSCSQLNIDNLKEVNSIGANIRVHDNQPFSIDLRGRDIVIDNLLLAAKSELRIELKMDEQILRIKNDSLAIDVQVGDAHININDGQIDTIVKFEIPQLFKLGTFTSVATPINILMKDTTEWSVRNILISDISFEKEISPGSGKFISSITSAKVKILETEKEIELNAGDWLLLEKLENRNIVFTKSKSDLKIHLEGQVSGVRAGSELFEKTLKPTIIEYLYYAKSFALFWSCMIFIWTLLWSFKNTFLSK